MINKITLKNVASYKDSVSLETDKKVNLIYGLNGSGKSTLSHFFMQMGDNRYKDCSIEPSQKNHNFLVYNQSFVKENFYESETLKGIFTLSHENKEAKIKINNATQEKNRLNQQRESKITALQNLQQDLQKNLSQAQKKLWAIKTDYSGGDRVLEFCLEGKKGSKESLFSHLNNVSKPLSEPVDSVDDLKAKIQAITGDNAQQYNLIEPLFFSSGGIETNEIFQKKIIGNTDSSVSALYTQLGNSDWVQSGLSYLPEKIDNTEKCPFCQKDTITNELINNIRDFFDKSYKEDIKNLKKHLNNYEDSTGQFNQLSEVKEHSKFTPYVQDFEKAHAEIKQIFADNIRIIKDKINTPSTPFELQNPEKLINELNRIIDLINDSVKDHNQNISQKEIVKNIIKNNFWTIMRWKYEGTLSAYRSSKNKLDNEIDSLNSDIRTLQSQIKQQDDVIIVQQDQTINIDSAIKNINQTLQDIGVSEFYIEKNENDLYKLARNQNVEHIFTSLSEGEKMLISFIYFVELCKGTIDVSSANTEKIIVIDDPISSLSHIHVFNIGRLIKNEFFGKRKNANWNYPYDQVFILTHSLYFFYEITETKHESRKESQKLLRISKNDGGSKFHEMKYEEIQNDYQAYWYIIKDGNQPPALIANCMRNVIEYFYNFVEKKDLNNFFQQEPLNQNKYQAFYRYINRESHSLGQNIYDYKEFNYEDFKDGFKQLFYKTGYQAHYDKMIK